MTDKLTVEIPEFFLLTIAVHGNMGGGELPDIMRVWAQNECQRLGLMDKYVQLQKDRLRELEKRIRNVLGNDAVDKLNSDIRKAAKVLKDL
jgi:hypothetical protein